MRLLQPRAFCIRPAAPAPRAALQPPWGKATIVARASRARRSGTPSAWVGPSEQLDERPDKRPHEQLDERSLELEFEPHCEEIPGA